MRVNFPRPALKGNGLDQNRDLPPGGQRERDPLPDSSLSPTAVILNAMWYLPRVIRSGLLASPCLTPHSLSLSSKHFPFVLVHGGDHQ